MKTLVLLLLMTTAAVFAQDELEPRFLRSHETLRTPINIPLSVTEKGDLEVLGRSEGSFFFSPITLITLQRSTINFIEPEPAREFSFIEQKSGNGWVEVKRARSDFGLGLAALMAKETLSFGIIPFQGSFQTTIRQKTELTDKRSILLPRELRDLELWSIGDYGSFQAYGGFEITAGLNAGGLNVLSGSYGLHNQFAVEVFRFSEDCVLIKLSEDEETKRVINAGPFVADAAIGDSDSKRLTIEFRLEIHNEEHQRLYAEALKGNIKLLQETLSPTEFRSHWKGIEKRIYFGIPVVAGRSFYRGHFVKKDESKDLNVDIFSNKNSGLLTPLRVQQKFVYERDGRLLFYWLTEMKKVSTRSFEKHFLRIGRALKIKGFNQEPPHGTKFGSVIGHLSLNLEKSDIETISESEIPAIEETLKAHCEGAILSCRWLWKRKLLMNSFLSALRSHPQERTRELGKVLVKEPALIYSIIKTYGLKKKAYFRFLSEKYQSLEGAAEVGP